jgi:MFS family permease
MYEPYPSAGRMPESARPEPPPSVQTAVKLMFAGAIVSAIDLIVSLVTVSNIKSTLHSANPSLTPTQLHDLQTFVITLAVVSGAIGIGLWTWMALANRAGRSWARILATVLFGIYTLLLLLGFTRGGAAAGSLVSLVIWLIGLGTIIMLWRRESSDYFNSPRMR